MGQQQLYRLPAAATQAVQAGEALRKEWGRGSAVLLVGRSAVPLSDLVKMIRAGRSLAKGAGQSDTDGGPSADYIDGLLMGGREGYRWAHAKVAQDTVSPLYIRRPVINGPEIVAWARGAGMATTFSPNDLHVTQLYSKAPVDWSAAGAVTDPLTLPASPDRSIKKFGKTTVMTVKSSQLQDRHKQLRDLGASHDFDTYQPHISLGMDSELPDGTEPYSGQIVLDGEHFSPIDDHWEDRITEKEDGHLTDIKRFETGARVVKVDETLGLVMGFAIICKVDGQDYYDVQEDHIPEASMLEAATDFMINSRAAKAMHRGEKVGQVVFAFPLTTDIAKAFGISSKSTGLMIAMKPDDDMLAKFKSGDYTGFSIGGRRLLDEEAA